MPNNDSNKENFQYGLFEGFFPPQLPQKPISPAEGERLKPDRRPFIFIGDNIPNHDESGQQRICEQCKGPLFYDRRIYKEADEKGRVIVLSDLKCTGDCTRSRRSTRKIIVNTHKMDIRTYKPPKDDNR